MKLNTDIHVGQMKRVFLLRKSASPQCRKTIQSYIVAAGEERKDEQSKFPLGWNSEHVKKVLTYYQSQSKEEATAEDGAVFEDLRQSDVAEVYGHHILTNPRKLI